MLSGIIQEVAADSKAFPQLLELSRALKGIISVPGFTRKCTRDESFGRLRRRYTMTTTALDGKKSQTFAEVFLWWAILAVLAAAVLLLPASRAGAQTPGPLPATAPSDQPVASSRAAAPPQIGGKPNLSGTWALNKDESDDPRTAMQQAGNSGGNGNGGGGHYGAGGGGGNGGGGGQHGGSGGGGRHGAQNGPGGGM